MPDMNSFGDALDGAGLTARRPGLGDARSVVRNARSRRRIVVGAWSAGVLATGVAVYSAGVLVRRASTKPSAVAGPPSIAVLPFENPGASADDYFADGMTDAVRGSLAELPELRVIGRNTSLTYKSTKRSQTQIARELGARYLVTGTVRLAHVKGGPDEVEVRPELVEVVSDSAPIVRWDQPIDAPLTDVFKGFSLRAGYPTWGKFVHPVRWENLGSNGS